MKLKEKCEIMAGNYQVVNRIVPNDKTQKLIKFYERYARYPEFRLKIFHRGKIELSYASTLPLFETIKKLDERLKGKVKEAPKPPPTKVRVEREGEKKKKKRR